VSRKDVHFQPRCYKTDLGHAHLGCFAGPRRATGAARRYLDEGPPPIPARLTLSPGTIRAGPMLWRHSMAWARLYAWIRFLGPKLEIRKSKSADGVHRDAHPFPQGNWCPLPLGGEGGPQPAFSSARQPTGPGEGVSSLRSVSDITDSGLGLPSLRMTSAGGADIAGGTGTLACVQS